MSVKMKSMRSALLLAFLLFVGSISAQTVLVNVKDSQGEPVIGASVVEKDTKNGGITDFDGNFTIKLTANKPIVISYIGMKSQTIDAKGKSTISVTLQDDNTQLQEVVAIGYGTVKKKDLTGSVATVNSDALMAVPVANASEALTGKMAGVQVTTTEGSPDADVKIRVRGGGSITQSNDPLYIVDGFPVESISDIPSSDIEDITVLKDASSTAIYGSRGANGVILVTTKSGKEGKVNVSYNFYFSMKKMLKKLDVLSAGDYAKWQYEHAQLLGHPDYYTKYFGEYNDMDIYNSVETNDWQDQVYGRVGHTMNHALNISGGTDATKYAFSFAHMDDKAIMKSSDFRRDNLSLKLKHKIGKKVTLDFQTRWSRTTINGGGANEQSSAYNTDKRLRYAIQFVPFPVAGITGLSDDDSDPSGNFYHPLVSISDNDQQRKRTQLNMSGAFTWEIIKDLKFKTEFGYDTYNVNTDRFYGTTTYYVKNVPTEANQGKPAATLTRQERRQFRNTNTLSYDFKKLFGKNSEHHLDMLLGQEYILKRNTLLTNTAHGFATNWDAQQVWSHTNVGVPYEITNYSDPNDVLSSYFARANYNFMSRYYVSATFRADGSSKFAKGNRWGYFPTASLAWRISDESFMKFSENWLDDLKIRVSYGVAGNNNIPSGLIQQLYESNTTSWINGVSSYWAPSKTMANPDLKWETTHTRNLGLDYSFLRSRINGTIELYWNTTKDLLINYPVAGTGYDYQYRNLGETSNKGIEFTINGVIVDKKDWGINVGANISFNKNKVEDLGNLQSIDNISTGWASTEIDQDFIIKKGEPIGQIYGYKSAGFYTVDDFDIAASQAQGKWVLKNPNNIKNYMDASSLGIPLQPGSIKLVDNNNDGLLTTADRTIIGDTNPTCTGGFNINARWKEFDFAANFNFSLGNDVYNANFVEFTQTGKYRYRNMITEVEDGKRWTNIDAAGNLLNWNNAAELAALNVNASKASPYTTKYILTDEYVQKASFLRLGTVTLGYTIPKKYTQMIHLSSVRVYFTGYNLLTFTGYDGTDPEVNSIRRTNLTPGVDYSAYPKSRQYVFGINVNL